MYKNSTLQFLILVMGLAFLCGCNSYGRLITVDGTEVYFDGEQVTEAQATKLGQTLKKLEFTDGTEKAVKLERSDGGFVFKMVMQPESIQSGSLDRDLSLMCLQLSAEFDGQQFECHACDETLTSKRAVTGLRGKRMEFGKAELYYNDLTDQQLAAVKEVLKKLGFMDFQGSMYFGQSDNHHEFRMVCDENAHADEELQRETGIWQDMFAQAIGQDKVSIMLCDEYFDAQFTKAPEN